MSKNVKLQVFLDFRTYSYIIQYQAENHLKTESQAVFEIIKRNIENKNRSGDVSDRLNKVIQGYEKRIRELEYELRTKDIKKAEIIKPNKKEDKK